jgi:PadR family transcriptional regulator, regulatory protein PadR
MTESKGQFADSRQLYSGLIRLHILHHSGEGDVFGLRMIEELARHGYKLSPGTLYPILHGLERDRLLRSNEVCVSGKIRRVYRITGEGQKALAAAKDKVRELFGELFSEPKSKDSRPRPRVMTLQSLPYQRQRASKMRG